MKCREKPYSIGSIVKVKNCHQAYNLPEGLKEGMPVMVLDFDHGTVTVETDSTEVFEVNMVCVDNGKEFEFEGKWYDENHLLIKKVSGQEVFTPGMNCGSPFMQSH